MGHADCGHKAGLYNASAAGLYSASVAGLYNASAAAVDMPLRRGRTLGLQASDVEGKAGVLVEA